MPEHGSDRRKPDRTLTPEHGRYGDDSGQLHRTWFKGNYKVPAMSAVPPFATQFMDQVSRSLAAGSQESRRTLAKDRM